MRDLPRDEQLAAARGFVIEEDPRAREDPITLPIVYRDVVAVDLRDAIRAPRVEGRQLVLRARADLAEHFRGGRLIEADLVVHAPDGLEQPRHAERRDLPRQDRLVERRRHERLGGEVIYLVGPDLLEQRHQRRLVVQVALAQLEPSSQVLDPLGRLGRRAAKHPEDLVALLQEQLGEVRAVLARDPGDERPSRHSDPSR